MTDGHRRWPSFEAEGATWEVRLLPEEPEATVDDPDEHDIIEFRSAEGLKPPRRLAVPAGSFDAMDDEALLAAFREARPIGGDYYGRPGKRMPDANP